MAAVAPIASAAAAAAGSLDDASDKTKNISKTTQDKENRQRETTQDEVDTKNCFECKRSLAAAPQLIDIAGKAHKWHPECFKCNICHEPMDRATSCHIYKDKILCKNDYIHLKRDCSINCARCRWPVGPVDWVRKAGDYVYHLACFNCDICLRQLNTGEQFAINVEERDHIVRLLCRLHFTIINTNSNNNQNDNNNKRLQARTTIPINDCQNQFNNEQQPQQQQEHKLDSTLSGHYQQKQDDLTASLLSRQQQQLDFSSSGHRKSSLLNCGDAGISATSAYHQHRVVPSQQQHQLPSSSSSSSSLALNQNLSSTQATATTTLSFNSSLKPVLSSSSSPPQAGGAIESHELASKSIETTKCNTNDLSIMSASPTKQSLHPNPHHAHYQHCTSGSTSSLSSDGSSSGGGGGQATISGGGGGVSSNSNNNLPSKSKRVRTTFTEDQLSILQNHFHIDSNPDGQDLERIATITGLSKRVTQVWFQNSRARQKKYMIKRKPGGSSLSGICSDSGSGLQPMTTNLIASAASITMQQSLSSSLTLATPTPIASLAISSQGPRLNATSSDLLTDSIRSIHCDLTTGNSVKGQLPKYQTVCSDGGEAYQSNDGDSWSSKNSDLTIDDAHDEVRVCEDVDNSSQNEDDDDDDEDFDQMFKDGDNEVSNRD